MQNYGNDPNYLIRQTLVKKRIPDGLMSGNMAAFQVATKAPLLAPSASDQRPDL